MKNTSLLLVLGFSVASLGSVAGADGPGPAKTIECRNTKLPERRVTIALGKKLSGSFADQLVSAQVEYWNGTTSLGRESTKLNVKTISTRVEAGYSYAVVEGAHPLTLAAIKKATNPPGETVITGTAESLGGAVELQCDSKDK